MTLIEALHEKKNIKKKVQKISEELKKYSSITSAENPAFKTEDAQRNHVKSLIQSALDLLERKSELKKIIDYTNLNTKITIPKGILTKEHVISITEALQFQQDFLEYTTVMSSLNLSAAENKLRSGFQNNADGSKAKVIQLFEEEYKISVMKDLHNKYDFIQSRKEIINATTEVLIPS